jgi:hypothetical protein
VTSRPEGSHEKIELLNRQRWRTNLELAIAMADYMEHFYNTARRHSSLGYLTPTEFEDLHSTTTQQATFILKSGPPNGVNPKWSGCRDLNPGPPRPERGALTKLRYSPSVFLVTEFLVTEPFAS